ncbi:hypothetical protein NDU88_005107 [Pleurodeles waltl]|uniref:Uncharacterized protein n=1 Tax=Pleurodeles waltl TaxID=8319 RepID=A0AAV7W6X6_PLEWA|nr:hypothetical protein NDU88_005107 [Pleurodeles waltl]
MSAVVWQNRWLMLQFGQEKEAASPTWLAGESGAWPIAVKAEGSWPQHGSVEHPGRVAVKWGTDVSRVKPQGKQAVRLQRGSSTDWQGDRWVGLIGCTACDSMRRLQSNDEAVGKIPSQHQLLWALAAVTDTCRQHTGFAGNSRGQRCTNIQLGRLTQCFRLVSMRETRLLY